MGFSKATGGGEPYLLKISFCISCLSKIAKKEREPPIVTSYY
jgi:hypothetical protein